MPKFAANLTMLFTEVTFLERFALARKAGMTTAESKLVTVGERDVLMVKRFDREKVKGGYTRARMATPCTSKSMMEPVIRPDSSLARNRIVRATSCGLSKRPKGWAFSACSSQSGGASCQSFWVWCSPVESIQPMFKPLMRMRSGSRE